VTLREMLFKKGIISEEKFTAKFKKLDREMKERRGRVNISVANR